MTETPAPKNLMDSVDPMAARIAGFDEKITRLNAELKELKSEREEVSVELVDILQAEGIDTSVGLKDGSLCRLETKTHPSVLNMEGFLEWAQQNGIQLPALQFNPATLQAWYKEQMQENMPIPPIEIVKAFIKTRIKINKRGG